MVYYRFYHCLGNVHISLKVGERHFGFYHPKFRGVSCGIASFRSESRSESIYVTERHRIGFRRKLSRYRQRGGLTEKVLGIIDFAVLGFRRVFKIESSNLEHCACAFAIASRNKRSMNVNETSFIEKFVNSESRLAPYTENCAESIGPRS